MEYTECLKKLSPWFKEIISLVKKDLKQEHLARDVRFVKEFFPGKKFSSLSLDEMSEGYLKVIENSSGEYEELASFIASRWVLKKTEIYDLFFDALSSISSETESIKSIPSNVSEPLIQSALGKFCPIDVYLFSEMNFVVFSPEEKLMLRQKALEGIAGLESCGEEKVSEEILIAVRNCSDRYEKKISGMQKKYLTDIAALKKQISTLQKKLCKLQGV
ncbi:hypothetical protein [Chlamydiifrater phoenicopteri]|uniref:hypothetical protein n=1 Tax=Chlamydiifrater phoenicopteri TaxID=2681469 RepID=UPI001BCC4ADD|nr:hypothetical protein [Chlamydiifrater phoenicopteri]